MSSGPNSVRPLFPKVRFNLYPDLIFNRLKGALAFLGTKQYYMVTCYFICILQGCYRVLLLVVVIALVFIDKTEGTIYKK